MRLFGLVVVFVLARNRLAEVLIRLLILGNLDLAFVIGRLLM